MHHRGCTRGRAINLHFIIFHDAFNNDGGGVPSPDPGRVGAAKESGKVEARGENGVKEISSTVYFTTLAPTLQFHSY